VLLLPLSKCQGSMSALRSRFTCFHWDMPSEKVIREWQLIHRRVEKTTRQAYEGVLQTAEYIIIIYRKSLKPLHIFCLGCGE